jgi:hypothetical protein
MEEVVGSIPTRSTKIPFFCERDTRMIRPRLSWFALGWGLVMVLAVSIVAPRAVAADTPPIVADWEGTLDPGAKPKQRVVVHITAAEDGTLSGTIDYPDQSASGISITAITFKAAVLHFESSSNLCVYDGTMSKDSSEITGTWKQGGASLSLILKRTP